LLDATGRPEQTTALANLEEGDSAAHVEDLLRLGVEHLIGTEPVFKEAADRRRAVEHAEPVQADQQDPMAFSPSGTAADVR
jgi:hypothetical protein